MPELNTNLLASIGQNTADVGKAYGEAMSLKNLASEQQLKDLQIKQIRSDLKKQQDIESLSKGVDWSDPKAAQAGISKITQRDPATGMALNKQYTDLATAKNQMSEQELNLLNTKNDVIAGSLVGVKTEYDKLIAEGKDPKLAAAMVTPLYIQAAQGLAKQKEADGTPMLDKEHLQAIQQNPAYNDEVVTGWIEQSQKSRDFLKGQLELHQKAKEDTETVRHDKEQERIEQEKADIEKQKAISGGSGGGRQAVMTKRVISSANEAAQSIENMIHLPVGASSGVFGVGGTPGTSLFGAAKGVLTNKIASQDVQDYNTMVAGLKRNLATIETAGLAPSGSLTDSMASLELREGDTNLTKMRKFAEMRQVIEKGLEGYLDDPTIPQQNRDFMKGIVSKVTQVVPYTQDDVTNLEKEQEKNPDITMQEYMKNQKGGDTSIPTATNPKTGQKMVFKDGKWQ